MIRIIADKELISLEVDHQHISRLTLREIRELVLQILVFGGKDLREDVEKWLTTDKIDQIAEVISPEQSVQR